MRERDLLIIGGGITGASLFQSAASLGLSVLLLEKGTAGAQTTGASSGLVHGGLRYLPYDLATTLLCCRECGALRRLFPALLRRQVFLWPVFRSDRFGLELVESLLEYYDRYAELREGRPHVRLSAEETRALEPRLERRGLAGAVTFDEWAVDPVALVRLFLEAGRRAGGEALENARVAGFEVRGGRMLGARLADGSTVSARLVVNATGPWAEQTARLAGAAQVRLTLRKGIHLVLERSPSRHGLIFQALDGRAVGLYPRGPGAWIGPTDDAFPGGADDPVGTAGEADLLSRSLLRVYPFFVPEAARAVAGLRPILSQSGPGPLSRDYRVYDHAAEGLDGFVTVTGGKLTVCRPMARDVLELAQRKLGRRLLPHEEPPPWPRSLGRAASLAASVAMLAYHAARHALSRPDRAGLELYRRTYLEKPR